MGLMRWNGHELTVTATALPRYFWLTCSIDVFLDGACVIRTGGVAKFSGKNVATIKTEGTNHLIGLAWRPSILGVAFRGDLSVDGEPIGTFKVFPRNWPTLFLPLLAAVLFWGLLRHV